MHISITKGTEADLPAVYDLVKALAVYEKAEDQVRLTIEDYRRHFAEGRYACLIARKEGIVIGMALYYTTFSTWRGPMLYLEDLMVYPAHQGVGAGRQLFEVLTQEARALGCVLMKWQVLDWNTSAIKFYEKIGAKIDKTWYNGYLEP